MPFTITPKFNLDQKVSTPFGTQGIIYCITYMRDGIQYYIQHGDGNKGYWYEDQLTAI